MKECLGLPRAVIYRLVEYGIITFNNDLNIRQKLKESMIQFRVHCYAARMVLKKNSKFLKVG